MGNFFKPVVIVKLSLTYSPQRARLHILQAISDTCNTIRGAFALVMLIGNKLIAVT